MSKPLRHVALLLAMFAVSALAGSEPTPEEYAALKAKVAAGDADVDYFKLRLGSAAAPDYHPNSPDSLIRRKAVQDAIEAKKFPEAAELVEHWLRAEFLNPFAHLGAARIYRELGDAKRADFHAAVVDGLYASICRSDEGESPRRPCRVLSIDEQHFYLVMSGLTVDGEYGQECHDGQPCEVYEVTERNTRRKHTIYFDISLPLAWQEAHRRTLPAPTSPQKP